VPVGLPRGSACFGVEMIGARAEVIDKAEDREKLKAAMLKIGLKVPDSGVARTLAEAQTCGCPFLSVPAKYTKTPLLRDEG